MAVFTTMTLGDVMMIAGVVCIILGVLLWGVFFFVTRNKCKEKISALADEYSCKNQEMT